MGERWEDGDVVGKRDGRKSTEHTTRKDRLSQPTEILGYRRGVRWREDDGGRGKRGRVTQR